MFGSEFFYLQIFAEERIAGCRADAAAYRLARNCREVGKPGLFRRAICMVAYRMIAIGASLLARYGESPESAMPSEPTMRRRRAM